MFLIKIYKLFEYSYILYFIVFMIFYIDEWVKDFDMEDLEPLSNTK